MKTKGGTSLKQRSVGLRMGPTIFGPNFTATATDITFPGVAATDNCTSVGALSIQRSPAGSTMVGLGTRTITATAVYAAGNAGSCSPIAADNSTLADSLTMRRRITTALLVGQTISTATIIVTGAVEQALVYHAVTRSPLDADNYKVEVCGAKSLRGADLSLIAAGPGITAIAGGNVHGCRGFAFWISGVAVAVKCPRSISHFIRIWAESTMVGVGTHTMTVNASYAGGGAGFVISTTIDSIAPLLTTRVTYSSSSVFRREEATTARKTFVLHLKCGCSREG